MGSRRAQRERRAIADVLVGAGYDEVYTLPLLAPADLTRAGMPTDGVVEVENPLRAEESILRPALLPGPAARGGVQRRARQRRTSRCSSSAPSSRRPRRATTLPREPLHVARWSAPARVRRAPHEPDRAGRPSHDVVAVVEALADELRLADWRLEAVGDAPGFHPARAAAVLVDGERVGRRRRGRPERASTRSTSPARSSRSSSTSTRCSPARRAAARAARRSRASRRRRSTSRSSSPTPCRPATSCATLRDGRRRAARSGSSCSTSSAPTRSGRAGSASRSRCSFRAPDRTLTDDEVAELRAARCIDAVVARARRRAARMTLSRPFAHRIRVRYAEIDGQGVVFNAHWLTYFDDSCTRFMESLGFGADFWINEFDVMLVKAVLEWSGPARFDEWIDIAGRAERGSARSRSTCVHRDRRGPAGVRGDDHLRRGRPGPQHVRATFG